MSETQHKKSRTVATAEARRLAEVARAAGLGDSPDAALEYTRDALALLGDDAVTPLLADVLRWQGTVLRDRGRTSEAEPLYRRSIEIAMELEYTGGRAHGLNCLAGLAQRRGDIDSAATLLSEALLLADRCGERRLVGMIQQNLGIIADIRGNPAAALAHYRVALRTFESTNDQQPLCWVLINLGLLHMKEQRFDAAEAAFERGGSIAKTRGDLLSEGLLAENRAELALIRGELDEAFSALQRAKEVAEQRADDVRRAAAMKLEGAHARMSGRPLEACDILRHALTLSAVGEDAVLGAEILYQFGLALESSGDQSTAHEVWNAALDAFDRIAARQCVGRVRKRLTEGKTDAYF